MKSANGLIVVYNTLNGVLHKINLVGRELGHHYRRAQVEAASLLLRVARNISEQLPFDQDHHPIDDEGTWEALQA